MKQFAATPRDGWVKASSVASPQIVSELARLSQENRELRELLQKTLMKDTVDRDTATVRTIGTLQANEVLVAFFYKGDKDWTPGKNKRTLFNFFFLVAPEMMVEKSTEETGGFLGRMWNENRDRELREKWPVPSNKLKGWLADLAALELIEPSKKRHPIADKNDYWTLTDFGRQIYVAIRKARLEAGLLAEDPIGEQQSESRDEQESDRGPSDPASNPTGLPPTG